MLVQLLTHTPEPEQVAAAAARLCYSASSVDQLLEKSRVDREALLRVITSYSIHYTKLYDFDF